MEFIAVLMGMFTIGCAVADFDWFMNNYKARPLVNLVGRDGARIFYGILGLIIILLGAGMAISKIG